MANTAAARDVTFIEANPSVSSVIEESEFALFHNNLIADTSIEAIGYTTRFGRLGTGFAAKVLHVPFTSYDDFGVQLSTGRYLESIFTSNISYNFFRSFNFDGVAVGANLKGAYRNIPAQIAANQSAGGVMADFGVTTRFDLFKFYAAKARNVAVGAVVRNLGPPVLGEPLPTAFGTGLSYSPIRPLLLAVDVTVPFHLFTSTQRRTPRSPSAALSP